MTLHIILGIVLTTILSTAYIGRSLNQDFVADKTIEEITTITQSAQKYKLDNAAWPDEVNNCTNAFNVLTTATTPTYLVNVDITSPFNTIYATNCTDTHFSLEVESTDFYSKYIVIKGTLPTIIKPAPDTATAVITIASALQDSVHDKFLALGDTVTTDTKYQGEGNEIENIADITLSNGRKLSETVQGIYTIDMNASPREFVPKPICLTGQVATPQLDVVGFFASNNKAIYGLLPFIDTANSNATQWAISINIYTEDGITTAGANTFIKATTYCE